MTHNLSYYQALPYTRRCQLNVEDREWFWLAWVEELPGCKVEGVTKAEAFRKLDELFDDYVMTKLEARGQIPEPTRWSDSGGVAGPASVDEIVEIVPSEVQSAVGYPTTERDEVLSAVV
jgi:predicted RNase H-like HicB family nuclease